MKLTVKSTVTNTTGLRIPFLDFLRSLSIVWLITYHSYWFLGLMLQPEQVGQLFSTPFSRFVFLGHNGVDIFFVLSGFLICQSAFSLREHFPNRWIRAFFIKRVFRILPALFFVVLLAFIINQFIPLVKNLENIWTNLLMVNNYLSIKDQALGWTWSLAIEEQFYLVFPFLFAIFAYRPKMFLIFCSILLFCSVIVNHFVYIGAGPWPSEIPFHPVLTPAEFVQYFDAVYSKTHVRFGPIVIGVICFLSLSKFRTSWALKFPRLFAFIALGITITSLIPQHAYFETIFQKPLIAVGIGLLIVLNEVHQNQLFKKISNWIVWTRLAKWSYAAFLINPIVILILAKIFKGLGALNSAMLFTVYFAFCQIVSFCIAALIYRWIEFPMNNWGRKLVNPDHDK